MRKNRKKSPSMTSLRNHRDVQTLSMNCNSGNIDHPVRVLTALAVLPQFSALSNPSTCRCTTAGVPTSPRTAPEESRLTSAQFALCTCLCEATAPPLCRRTEAEAPPRTRRKPAGTELYGHRDVHNGLSHRRGEQYLYPALAWRC